MRYALTVLASALLLALAASASARDRPTPPSETAAGERYPVTVHLFWALTCPHCARAKSFLEALAKDDPGVVVASHEITTDKANERAFVALTEMFAVNPPAVPLIMVGEKVFVGYDAEDGIGAQVRAAVAACRRSKCSDVTATVIARARLARDSAAPPAKSPQGRQPKLPDKIELPLFGAIELRSLSLPALTLVLGAVDGFNPCAMWVLVFLIGLLVGLHDPVRMWSYGALFLLTSAAVYFAFMAAWLNLFLLLGSLLWVRIAIGLFALGAGGYYLWQFASNPVAACPVASPGERQRIMSRLRSAVAEPSFLMASAGIIVLAVAVNLIELLCSAGIPAVYTQVLSMSGLPPAAHYGYLGLYIAVFVLDDVLVFVTAMLTLRAVGLAATYARFSHLVGGLALGGVGVLLLLRPDLLAFG